MLKTQYAEATQVFSELIQKTPDPGVASRARVKAGISQYRLNRFGEALQFFDKADAALVQENDRAKMGSLGFAAVTKTGAGIEQKAYYCAVLADTYGEASDATIKQRYGEEAPPRQDVMSCLEQWANAPANIGQVDERFRTYRAATSEPYVDYKLGMAYFASGDNKAAKKHLSRLVSRYPESPLAKSAQATLDKAGIKVAKEPKTSGKVYKIGVILPLSGKYEVYGKSTLNGMECAASQRPGCSGVRNIQIVSRDDRGEPDAAVQAVEDLVKNEKVQAIVGPLSSGSATAAARRAQELGVVMISLAQKEGIPAIGDYIFRFSLIPKEQVEALLKYATQNKKKKLFAVLYPNTNYGKTFFTLFEQMAPTQGGKVSASHGFSSAGNPAEVLRQLKFSVSQVGPQNPLGFEGLFIPDSYTTVLKLVPQMKNAGIENILLMGTNAWNDPSLAQKSGGALGDAVFLDVYFKDSDRPLVRTFVQEYQAAFGQSPSTLEAMGYDSIRFLGQALGRGKSSNPAEVRNAVFVLRGYNGVTGLQGFAPDREADVEPVLLTVEGGAIRELK
jgi:ABC-type branched-subunit amino acid transport system substrate-binding protein